MRKGGYAASLRGLDETTRARARKFERLPETLREGERALRIRMTQETRRKTAFVGSGFLSMAKDDKVIRVEATVRETLPHGLFKLVLTSGEAVLGHVSGELRLRLVRLLPGDKVTVEISPYDLKRGRIVEQETAQREG